MKTKGLRVETYRCSWDCTNKGVTSQHDDFLLIGDNIVQLFSEDNLNKVLILKKNENGYIYAVPYKIKHGSMFGGNFVYSSDSRFPSRQPIPVHDRFE